MTLIKSISGIRGTIGGKTGHSLTPLDVVKFTSAFAYLVKKEHENQKVKMVVGRDARISGEMINQLVCATLNGMGVDVIDLGLSTTPATEMAVVDFNAHAGIILTASHNPKQWNALKLLNSKGEFISAELGQELLEVADSEAYAYALVDELGTYTKEENYLDKHIDHILALPLVDTKAISEAQFSIVIDAVNSVGGIALPRLLERLGVKNIHQLHCEPTGRFAHNPEPLPEHLTDISAYIVDKKADLGFVVDPDVDRLAVVNEDGSMFGEEYTLVAVADYVLKHTPGNTVSNLSSTRALRDVTVQYGGTYTAAAVGEVNVVSMMKQTNTVIGGEGNGGIIYPQLHYGRDALVGIALFLTHLAIEKVSCSTLRARYPAYFMSKNKIELTEGTNPDDILNVLKERYKQVSGASINTIDGLKIDFETSWVHMRKSNTEPIIRIYAEANTQEGATEIAKRFVDEIKSISF